MNTVHVVHFGDGRARRYLASTAGGGRIGPPFVWSADASRAVAFASPSEARAFAHRALGHSLFDTGPAPAPKVA